MSTELKPCPRCGSRRLANREIITLRVFGQDILLVSGVSCMFCGYAKPTKRAWNKRRKHGR